MGRFGVFSGITLVRKGDLQGHGVRSEKRHKLAILIQLIQTFRILF